MARAVPVWVENTRVGGIGLAAGYIRKVWGIRVSHAALAAAADRGSLVRGEATIKVSWREEAGEGPEPGAANEGPPGKGGKPLPLLRYPPGEGPLRSGSRAWR